MKSYLLIVTAVVSGCLPASRSITTKIDVPHGIPLSMSYISVDCTSEINAARQAMCQREIDTAGYEPNSYSALNKGISDSRLDIEKGSIKYFEIYDSSSVYTVDGVECVLMEEVSRGLSSVGIELTGRPFDYINDIDAYYVEAYNLSIRDYVFKTYGRDVIEDMYSAPCE